MVKTKIARTKITPYLRPPIVTLMGHVDHGKTSLLDAIRKSQITTTESGGITQHTGAYTIEKGKKKITFIDTPGHEAFTQMRARGGQAADVVILVVAANDGVMPQTKEAIKHAKAADVPIIVAINKSDLESANPDKVKRQLAENDILVEGYGGDVVAIEVSAITKTGIDKLLEVIAIISEMEHDRLKADPEGPLEALVIESRHDQKRGVVVQVIVKNGQVKVGDNLATKSIKGRVRSVTDSNGKKMEVAVPGDAIEILGFPELPTAGDVICAEGEAKVFTESKFPESKVETQDVPGKNLKVLNIVIKADTVGTEEAIVASIKKIKIEDAVPHILLSGTGDVKESDVLLASTAKGIIMAFKVGVAKSVYDIAKSQKVIIREHDIIYKLLEEIEAALEGVLEIEESKIKGEGIVIKIFILPKSQNKVAGTLVEAGRFTPGDRVGIFREGDDVPLAVTRIRSVHIGVKEEKVAKKGQEAGLLFKPQVKDIQLEDKIRIL